MPEHPDDPAVGVVGPAGTTALSTSVTVAAGDKPRVTVGTITEGQTFVATSYEVTVVQDPAGDLAVGLFDGNQRVSPEGTNHTMNTDSVEMPAVAVYQTGSDVDVVLSNTAGATDFDVSVRVDGVNPARTGRLEEYGTR